MAFLSSAFKSDKLTSKIALILLAGGILFTLFFIHTFILPWMDKRLNNAITGGRNWCNYRIQSTIQDGTQNLWIKHAYKLIEIEKSHIMSPIKSVQLEELAGMPGVLDAFYLNFADSQGVSLNNVLSDSVLLEKLNKFGAAGAGGAHYLARRAVGGLAKFRSIDINDQSFTVMVIYVGTYYPSRATEAIGMVLDRQWHYDRVPIVLDSLAKNDMNMLWFASCPPDTFWGDNDDPYAAVNGSWKQTLGLVHGEDTLWWYGDPKMDMKYAALPGGQEWEHKITDAFGVTHKCKVEFSVHQENIMGERKEVKTILYIIEFIGILSIVLLVFSVKQARKQVRRNNLALAHLAHSIKTPVTRIRLDTDSLLEEMVASPEEEHDIITAINHECERLERAVLGAALSLEKGIRIYNLERCDLTQIITDTVSSWKQSYDKVGIGLSVEMDDVSLVGNFDSKMLTVMLDNLLDNALRHTELNIENITDEASVTVILRKTTGKVGIIIDDMGSGVPKSDRKRIFDRFTRVKGDVGSGVSGLGLGLSLVKEIIKGHNGQVRVEDSDAGGARFIVELPI